MGGMLSLLDVLPAHERVDIGGGKAIDVSGISAEDLGKLLARYPNALVDLIESKGSLAGLDPSVLGAFIAASQRNGGDHSLLGNEQVEMTARNLSAGAQVLLVQTIGRLTFPEGIGPFLQRLSSMLSGAQEVFRLVAPVGSRAPSTNSPDRPRPSEPPSIPPSGS